MRRHELWAAIVATTVELERLVVERVGSLPQRGPVASATPRTRAPQIETAWRELGAAPGGRAEAGAALRVAEPDERDREGLVELRAAVGARVQALWIELESLRGIARIREALVIYFDERAMSTLPEYLRLSWPLLQTEVTGSKTGGADFFRFVDRALDDPKTPSSVFEVYYFCLSHGFRGRHGNEPVRLEEYRRKLSAAVEFVPPATAAGAREDVGALRRVWPAWAYYVSASVVVVLITISLTMLTNYEPGDEDKSKAEQALDHLNKAIDAASERCAK